MMQAAQGILRPSCPSHPERMECAPSHHHCSSINPHGTQQISSRLRVVPRSHLLEECQQPFSSQVLTFFLQTVDEMRAQKFCPASFSKSPTDILLPLPGHAHRAPSMALREKQRTCSKRFPERAAKAGRARGPTPQKSQNTREERREIECESDLRGVALHFTWPQTPPAIGGGSSSRNANLTRSAGSRQPQRPACVTLVLFLCAARAIIARAII